MLNILITGGAGYIGRQLIYDLLRFKKYRLYVIDNFSTGNKKFLPKKVELLNCCISNDKKVYNFFKKIKIDCVIHLAAYISVEESEKKPKKYLNNNYYKSVKFVNNCIKTLKVKNFIVASTGSVYGDRVENKLKESFATNPINFYAKSKIKLENYFLNLNINFALLRFFNVAGADPENYTGQINKKSTHLIKIICENTIKNKLLKVYGNSYPTKDGTAIRDYIHVKDLSLIIIKIIDYITKKKFKEIINCGYGKGRSVLDIIKNANLVLPKKINYKIVNKRKGDAAKVVADISKLKKILKFKPKFNSLKKIIKHSYNWEKKINLIMKKNDSI